MVKCKRGHKGHMVTFLELNKKGKAIYRKRCDYILGVIHKQGSIKTIQCCDIPIGEEPPKDMLPIGNIF